jgi:O-antigen biosynthesis protein
MPRRRVGELGIALFERIGGRRGPLEYRRASVSGTDASPGPVDMIVPVHGAAADFRRCLASVRAHTDLARHRLVVVVDGAGQDEVEAALADAERAGAAIHVIRQVERLGFVASVNRGMAASRCDVVLLNSDAIVTSGWLEKLQAAAYSAAKIATATPFSNDATICSVPRFLEANALPAGHDIDSFARLVERASARAYPRLPTGVGVCLYIKRRALDHLGAFEPRAFGLGYGEETDFCVRAVKAGWAHVLDDATFVFHAGHRSFGESSRARVRAAELTMRWRHREWRATIASFIAEDPLGTVRERVLRALGGRS